MNEEVIVRFAPSPTGYLHIGGARTAIFNWLFIKRVGGKLILRIEDTDAERSDVQSVQGIIDSLKWLGIAWDEGPYFQSRFIDDHLSAAEKLIKTDFAYRCFCSRATLDQKRREAIQKKSELKYDGTCRNLTKKEIVEKESNRIPYTIRFKVPRDRGSVVFEDIVYGKIEKKYKDLDDFVLVRSNGQPLYILSNAVDDIRDRITHIIRGQDGLANAPKQILIYKALGAPIPKFAHMSLTLDPQKAKISKRTHGELVAVHFYKENGFLPWALVNFLVHLGWSTPDSQEIFSREELIEAFSLEGISRANSIFNIQKGDPKPFTDPRAIHINAHHLRNLPIDELEPFVRDQLKKEGIWENAYENEKNEWFLKTIDLIRGRYHLMSDFTTLGRAYFSDDYSIDSASLKENILKHPELNNWLPILAKRLNGLDAYTAEKIEEVIRESAQEFNTKVGILVNAIRTAITGQSVGPGLIEAMIVIGQRRVAERLKKIFANTLSSFQ
jgi:glutamyl-tRNA synthetase